MSWINHVVRGWILYLSFSVTELQLVVRITLASYLRPGPSRFDYAATFSCVAGPNDSELLCPVQYQGMPSPVWGENC